MKIEITTEELDNLRTELAKVREENAFMRGRLHELERQEKQLQTVRIETVPQIRPFYYQQPYVSWCGNTEPTSKFAGFDFYADDSITDERTKHVVKSMPMDHSGDALGMLGGRTRVFQNESGMFQFGCVMAPVREEGTDSL